MIKCEHCDVPMTLHSDGKLYCHYCGAARPMVSECPKCHSKLIGTMRAGTERIEGEIRSFFPESRILRMDADSTKGADGFSAIIRAFNSHQADILLGTQMIVKGHDFPGVTLMGVLAADLSLNVPDYSASERTFDLLLQACGRSGRGETEGCAIIQTYQPEHFSIQAAANGDYSYFYKKETSYRRLMHYPPFSHLLTIEVTAAREKNAIALGRFIVSRIDGIFPRMLISGPNPCPVVKIKDIYHYEIVAKDNQIKALIAVRKAVDETIAMPEAPKNADVWYDFDD